MKPSRKQLKKVLPGMVAKAQELGWSHSAPEAQVKEAIEKPKFVYVKLGGIFGAWKRGKLGKRMNSGHGGFILRWGAEKIGFGEITFLLKNKRVICDTERMSPGFAKAVIEHFLSTQVIYDPEEK